MVIAVQKVPKTHGTENTLRIPLFKAF